MKNLLPPCPDLSSYNYNSSDGFNNSEPGLFDPQNKTRLSNESCWHFPTSPYRGFKKVMDNLNIYFTPIIIIIGITGNLLSFIVFTRTHLRRQSSSVYLASLAMVDIIFLLSLCIVWLSWIKIPLFHRQGWCQVVVYMMYVCTFLSVWLVTSFTIDRFIMCYYPLRKDRYCTTKRARIVVIILILCGLVMYSFATWTSGVNYINSYPMCMPFPQYFNILTTLTGIDSAVTLIIPCSLVIVLNIRIVVCIMKMQKHRQPFVKHLQNGVIVQSIERKSGGRLSIKGGESLSSGCPVHVRFQNHSNTEKQSSTKCPSGKVMKVSIANISSSRPKLSKSQVRNSNHQYRTARMLIIVSSVFVLFNLPGHIFRIHAFIQSSLHDEFSANRKDLTWHEIFQLVYHLNFSINFFIYSFCGRQFRTGLKILYTRISHKTRHCRGKLRIHKNKHKPRKFTQKLPSADNRKKNLDIVNPICIV